MSADLTDLFMLQLAQQASLHNLTNLKDRRRSADRVAAFFMKMLELLPVSISMEIGAQEATFSRGARAARPEITARAFEANPNVYAQFMRDGELGRLGVDYRHYAVGNKDVVTEFHIYESIMGQDEPADSRRQSSLLRSDSPGDSHYAISVPLVTLDSFCAADAPESRYALWIDAEGFGMHVLEGAEAVLERTLAVYIEMESIGKFEGQALDREIMAFLLDHDFIPILRDFKFEHQYNAVFVKKDSLPLVEHEWHRYFQAVLRNEFANVFCLAAKNSVPGKVLPPDLERITFKNILEFREAMESLPHLRVPVDGLDPAKTAVVCHVADLAEAKDFYKAKCRKQPEFYVLGQGEDRRGKGGIHDFSELRPGMNLQLYFKPCARPDHACFLLLARELAVRGIASFNVERYCISSFWQRSFASRTSARDLEVMCDFCNILADFWSQYTYMALCHANMCGKPGYIPMVAWPQYCHPLVHAVPGDIICEGGLEFFRDDNRINSTTIGFCNALNGRGRIYGFEPVLDTFAALKELCQDKPIVQLENAALWSHEGFVALYGKDKPHCAHTAEAEQGDETCPCVSIDGFFADKQAPTLIKLDVEGAEPEILKGAQGTMRRNAPKLMVAIYHGCNGADWVTVPEILMNSDANYEYFCGHHTPWYAESFVYGRKNIEK